MASRRVAREFALQALFHADLARTTAPAALDNLWASALDDADGELARRAPDAAEIEFAAMLAHGVEERRAEIDAAVEASSTNWRMARMAAVDRNILRLGAFEILYSQDTPASVAINEAVELAKRFGSSDSRAFVNGVLDRVARDVGRL